MTGYLSVLVSRRQRGRYIELPGFLETGQVRSVPLLCHGLPESKALINTGYIYMISHCWSQLHDSVFCLIQQTSHVRIAKVLFPI
jgi:hypothetical protein